MRLVYPTEPVRIALDMSNHKFLTQSEKRQRSRVHATVDRAIHSDVVNLLT